MLKTVSSITNAIGALNYKGTWDANANSPALTSSVGTKGDYYVVGTAGSTTLDGISNWGIGDWAVFNGSAWQRVEGGADLNGVNLSYTGTLTGGTGIANLGAGQFYKDATGNIGFSNTSPSTKLHIGTLSTGISTAIRVSTNSGGNPDLLVLENGANRTTGRGTRIAFYNPNGSGTSQLGAAILSGNENSTVGGPEFLDIQTGTGGTIATRMRYFASGGVSVGGTTDPGAANFNVTGLVGLKTAAPLATLHIANANTTGSSTAPNFRAYANSPSYFEITNEGNDSILLRAYRSDTTQVFTFNGHSGNLTIFGALAKGSGSFKIDHPLLEKEETHHLVHSFVEAPRADNIYRGKVTLAAGTATVNIDTNSGMTEGTFVALNRDVQCFTSNESGWDAVRGSVSGNILTIECQNESSTATVSWMVIGERQDKHMYETDWTDENGRVIVEPEKVIVTPVVEQPIQEE